MTRASIKLLKNLRYYGTAVALLIGGWLAFGAAAAMGSYAMIGGILVGCGLILGAAILLSVPLAGVLSTPWGSLFYPGAKFDRPQPLYSLAEAQARREEYEKALTTYEQIAVDFPGEVRPWIGMVEIAVTALHDVKRADVIYERGIRQLPQLEARESLARMYRGIRSRLNEAPEWGKKRTIDLIPSPRARTGTRPHFR